MSFEFDIDASGVLNQLDRMDIAVGGASLRRFLEGEVDPQFRRITAQAFRREQAPSGGFTKWAPLAPSTQNIRSALGFPPKHPINRRTGALERFLTKNPNPVLQSGGGARMVWPGPAPNRDVEKAFATSQVGSKSVIGGHGNAPARPTVGADEFDLDVTKSKLRLYLAKEFTQ